MNEEYEQLGKGGVCRVMVHKDVSAFLKGEERNDRKNVLKIGRILKRLRDFGREDINNTEQFKLEGRYVTGNANGEKIAVYAVKSHQIRVYGGFLHIKGKQTFFCTEAVRKKQNKADMSKLKSAAKALGEIND